MFKLRRSLSQNFLHQRQLVKDLVGLSSIGKGDLVLEIGPGQGIITQELCQNARAVIAIENDPRLVKYLKKNLAHQNLTLVYGDAVTFPLPRTDYKVFSNLPFQIEGRFVRKLLKANQPPQEICLIVRKEPALRWAGIKNNSMFVVKYGPWFEFEIIHQFKASDFKPRPKVSAVMIKITQRSQPLLSKKDQQDYWRFVKAGYSGGRRIKQNLKSYFSKRQLITATQKLGISQHSKPTQVSLEQWVELFKMNKSYIS